VPKKMIQAGRGSARRLLIKVGCEFMGNKKPRSPVGKQG
jgi:hypothetical protein